MKRIYNERGRVNTALMIMAPLVFMAALSYGMRTALAWAVPDVAITSPSDGDSVSGTVPVSTTFSVSNGNIHSVVLLLDGVSVTTQPIGAQSGSYTFNWDSSVVGNGAHTIAVRAYTAAAPSTHFNETSVSVTVSNGPAPDITDPSITVALPADGQLYAAGVVAVNASLIDNVAVNAGSVVVKLDGSNVNSQLAINANAVTGNLNVSDGNHTLTIDCSDTSGNPAGQESISFKADTIAPSLSITSPVDGAVLHTATADISGAVSDAVSGVDSVMVNGSAATVSGGTFSLNGLSLNEGANVVTVIATDNAGHANTKTFTVTYIAPPPADTVGPALAVASPIDASTVDTASVNVTGTVSDAGSGVKWVKVNGAAAIINVNIFSFNNVALAEGANVITVVAEDNSNNTTQEIVNVTYEKPVVVPPADTDGPTLTVTSPLDGSTVDTASVNVSGTVSDAGSGVKSVKVNGAAAIINGDSFNINNVALVEGANAITVVTADNSGNTSQEIVNVTYEKPVVVTPPPADTTGPTLSVTSPIDGLTVDTATVNVTGTVSDADSGVKSVKVNGAAAIINGNSFSLNNVALAEGANVITVVATDNSGNTSQEVVNVTYERPVVVTPPGEDAPSDASPAPALTLEVTSPEDGLITNSKNVTVAGTTTNGAAVTVNGAVVAIGAGGEISYTAALAEGANTLTIKSCLGGDCMTETRAVTLDTRAPEIGGVAADGGAVYVSSQDNTGGSGLDNSRAAFTIDGDETPAVYDQTRKAYKLAASGLAGGAHTVTASVYDAAGNAAQGSVSFTSGAAGGGVTVAIENVPGKVLDGAAGVSIVPAAGGEISGPRPQGPAQAAGETATVFPSWNLQPSPAKAGAEGFIEELAKKDKERRENWPSLSLGGAAVERKPSPPRLDCGKLSEGAKANAATGGEDVVASVDGDIVAVADAPGGLEESGIVVRVDGAVVPHVYDKKTKKITARAKGLKKGAHTAAVTATDASGATGMATTAFGVDPIVYSITIDNADRPGSGRIAAGERARVTVTMDENNFTGAWISLMNADGGSPVGDKYYIVASDPASAAGPFEYATEAYFYTSTDGNGAEATAVNAGIPLDAPAAQFMTSGASLIIDNPPVNPSFNNVIFSNMSGGANNTINLGEMYRVDATGGRGMQGVRDVLLNVDTLLADDNPSAAAVRGDAMYEIPQYGAGQYISSEHGAALDNIADALGHDARALLPLVCSAFAGNSACKTGLVAYIGRAPRIDSVSLENLFEPRQPFTQPGQRYKITIRGDIPPEQAPYLKAAVVNSERMPQSQLFSNVNPYLTQFITEFTSMPDGSYTAEGALDSFTDPDNQLAANAAAAVTTTGFIESALSNTIAINESQPVSFSNLKMSNASNPDTMTIAVGERVRIEADGPGGLSLMCHAIGVVNFIDFVEAAQFPMSETPAGSGHYVCEGALPSRPSLGGVAAGHIIGRVGETGEGFADNILTFRGGISVVHLRNLSRAGAVNIAPGETLEITAAAAAGHTNIGAFLADALYFHSSLGGQAIFYQTDTLVEVSSGSYRTTAVLANVPQGVGSIRALAGSAQDLSVYPVMSNEVLALLSEAPLAITSIDGAAVVNGEATSAALSPVVTGTSPSNSTVNIYELTLGGGAGDMTPVAGGGAMSAEFVSGAYNIGAPALSFNGKDYNFMGTSGLLDNPCGGFPVFLPASGYTCLEGNKDIHVFLVTVKDFRPDPVNQPGAVYPEGAFTVYSAGDPQNPAPDQRQSVASTMDSLVQMGVGTSYTIDASGVAFAARGEGNSFIPVSPISGQVSICREEAGVGSLSWDGGANSYIGSFTPLMYNGNTYGDLVIWGADATTGQPYTAAPGAGVAVPWANGIDDITAAALDMSGGRVTLYAPQFMYAMLPPEISVSASAGHAMIAPGANPPGRPYTWNQSALDAAGLTTSQQTVCVGYGRGLIASVASAGAAFSTQTISFGTYGDKFLQAESVDAVTGAVKSVSGIVTYHLNAATVTVDVTPPVVSGYRISPEYISPLNSPGSQDAAQINAVVADINGYDWKVEIRNATESLVTYSGANAPVNILWDGRGATGLSLPEGTYTAVLTAMDRSPNNNVSGEATVAAHIDNTSPSAAIIQPLDGQGFKAASAGRRIAVDASATDNTGVARVEVYFDGAYATDAALNGVVYEGVLSGAALENGGAHVIEVAAVDLAGNRSATQTARVFFSERPAPPTRLAATGWPSGGLTLTWQPPTTNADGTPLLSAIAGYNIYVATETMRCDKIYAVAGSANPSCGPGIVEGAFMINAPALTLEGVEYADNPAGGNGPLWIDTQSQGTGLTPMPPGAEIVGGKTVFGFLVELRTGADGAFPEGLYRITGYAQASYSEVSDWIRGNVAEGRFAAGSRIVAHTPVCSYDLIMDVFASNKIPLSAVPRYDFNKLNGPLVSATNYDVLQPYLESPWTVFTATAVNAYGDESDFSDIVDTGGGM